MKPKSAAAGFTLIEFLIAATLLALMGAAVFGSLRVALNSYTRSQERLEQEGRQHVLEDMVRRQVGSLYPLVPALRATPEGINPLQGAPLGGLTGESLAQSQGGLQITAPLFYGSSSAMTFITVASFDTLRHPGLTVVRYGLAEDIWGDLFFGAMETPFTGPESFYQMVDVPEGEPIPVVEKVTDLSFEYYGYDPLTGIGEWYPEWSFQDSLSVPGAIRITADDLRIVVAINASSDPAVDSQREIRKLFTSGRST